MAEIYYLSLFIIRDDVKFLSRGFWALCFLSEKGAQCGSSGWVSAVSFSSAAPDQRAAGDAWTASHPGGPEGLDQLKMMTLAAACPIYPPSDMK